MSTETRPELQFGTLALVDPFATSGDGGYWFDTYGDDFALGSPQPVNEAIQTLLQDGSKVVTTGYDNREVSFTVVVSGSDMDALASGESALFLECSKPNTLTYTPADGYGAATVFEVWTSSLEPVDDDLLEVTRLQRAYKLSLTCAPFGGSDVEITTVGVTSSATPSTVVINDASTATNWTECTVYGGSPGYPATSDGSAIVLSAQADTSGGWVPPTVVYQPASPVDMSATTFFAVDWKTSGVTAGREPKVWADDIALTHLGTQVIAGSTYMRSLYLCPDVSVGKFRINMDYVYVSGTSIYGNYLIDQIVRTNQAPSSGTLRQKVTAMAVRGSARTQGSLKVEHETSALGDVIVYTCPDIGDGYTPPLRQWMTTTGASYATDSTLVSGAWNEWKNSVFTVPLRMLRPGPYLVVARMRQRDGAAGDKISVSAGDAQATVTFAALNVWQVQTVGVQTIADHVGGTSFSQILTANATLNGGTITVDVDEAWLFYVGEDAALTRIPLGTGTPSASGSSNRLFIDTATTSRPYPGLWRGTLADKSDARSAVTDSVSWGDHMFAPPSATIFTVTSNALDAKVSLTHRPRWHTHAGSIE